MLGVGSAPADREVGAAGAAQSEATPRTGKHGRTAGVTLLVGHRTTARVAGVSLGFEMLIDGFRERDLPHRIVDLASAGKTAQPGRFRLRRAARFVGIFVRYLSLLPATRRVYMTISTSRWGFVRDAAFIWSARVFKKRTILHLKGGGYRNFYGQSPAWLKAFIRATLGGVDALVVLGEQLRDQFCFLPDPVARIRVVHNGLPETHPGLLCREKALPDDEPVRILYLSNMIPSKGYWDVLEACSELMARNIDFRCSFCGEFLDIAEGEAGRSAVDAEREFLRAIRERGLTGNVQYHGVVRGDEKVGHFRRAHVFMLPTSYPWEGQPISIIEALAGGIPVVATPHRGITDQVIDRVNGVLVSPGRPDRLAEAVCWIIEGPTRYQELCRNAHRHYVEHFSREAHLHKLTGVILYSDG